MLKTRAGETYEVGGSVVLSDNGVPDGLSGTGHSHGQRQQSQVSHTVGVLGHQGLVRSNTGVVVHVSRLGETDDRVDQDVGLSLSGGSYSQLSVSSVHGVPGLEGDNLAPCHLLEEVSEFGRGVPQVDVVEVLRRLDGLDFTTDVVLLDVLSLISNGRVRRIVGAQDLLVLELEVGLVEVLDGQDGEASVVSRVAEGDSGALLEAELLDLLLRDIESDGHGEEVAVLESQGVSNAADPLSTRPETRNGIGCSPGVVGLVHEAFEGRETTIADQLQVTQVSFGQDDVLETSGLLDELLSNGEVSSVQVLELSSVGCVGHFDKVGKGYGMSIAMVFPLPNGLQSITSSTQPFAVPTSRVIPKCLADFCEERWRHNSRQHVILLLPRNS